MKKIVCTILCLCLSVFVLCSCAYDYDGLLLKHDYEKDYKQIIATVKPITESGTNADGEEWSYTSEEKHIYKSQLISYMNSYGSQYMQNYSLSFNDTLDYLLEQLIMQELIIVQADVMFESHVIFWTKEDIISVQDIVYDSLNSLLFSLRNEILDENGRATIPEPSTEAASETTYPVQPTDEEEAEREFYTYGSGLKHDDWYMGETWEIEKPENKSAYPGLYGTEDSKSLNREAMKRLVSSVKASVDSIFNLTEEEKKAIEEEKVAIDKIVEEKGIEYVYPVLGKTLMIKKLYGDSAIMQKKMELIQDNIESGIKISDTEIVNKYNMIVDGQITSYSTISNYDTAVNDGTDTILYRPNDDYVFVKHILLQFSDEQRAALTAYAATHTEEETAAERQRMANNIVVYRHVDGEDDTSRAYSVADVWAEIRAEMAKVQNDAYLAERKFDELIYKYNTDPGIFNNEMGYAVKYELGSDETDRFVAEFAAAARAFKADGYSVGQIYEEYVVTDHGVHIMYYNASPEAGRLSLDSYLTAGRYTSVRSYVESVLRESKISAAYTNWQNQTVAYYRNVLDVVTEFKDRYSNLYSTDE